MRITVVGSINLDLVARASHLPSAGETVTGATLQRHPGGKGEGCNGGKDDLQRRELPGLFAVGQEPHAAPALVGQHLVQVFVGEIDVEFGAELRERF